MQNKAPIRAVQSGIVRAAGNTSGATLRPVAIPGPRADAVAGRRNPTICHPLNDKPSTDSRGSARDLLTHHQQKNLTPKSVRFCATAIDRSKIPHRTS